MSNELIHRNRVVVCATFIVAFFLLARCVYATDFGTPSSPLPVNGKGSGAYLEWQANGSAEEDRFGYAVDAGDVDGDGKFDFVVGAPFADPGGLSNAGSVYVYSGATGKLLYQKDGEAESDFFGISVSTAGDVNSDGKAEFIVGACWADPGGLSKAGSTYVYDGATGNLLYKKDGDSPEIEFGRSVSFVGAINGDGKAEFLVGAHRADPGGLEDAGSAYVYDGATGNLLYKKDGEAEGDEFGWRVSYGGDVNGDGKGDFIVSAWKADPGGKWNAGSVYVYSGATGNVLYQKNGESGSDYFGSAISSAGYVNEDVKSDFIVGAPGSTYGGIVGAGSAYVYSGADGSLLYKKGGEVPGGSFGFSVSWASDVNNDVRADFIVGALLNNPGMALDTGSAYIYDGATGNLLYRKDGGETSSEFGVSVSTAGDVNGDDRADILVGAYLAAPGGLANAGAAYVFLSDFEAPTVTDKQGGNDTLYSSDPGDIFDVDFSDTGGANLDFVQYTVWSAEDMSSGTGSEVIPWTDIASDIDIPEYTSDWGVDFSSLEEGTGFVSVRAFDNASNVSSVATDVFYIKKKNPDSTPPSDISYVYDGTAADIDLTTVNSELSANWAESSDPESGIARYWYAIGTIPAGSDILSWADNATATSMTRVGLSLSASQTYYVSVKAENGDGLLSNTTSSDGATVATQAQAVPYLTINEGWNLAGVSRENASIDFSSICTSSICHLIRFSDGYAPMQVTESIDLDLNSGYWIYSSADIGVVNTSGNDYQAGSKEISLDSGWNLFANPYMKEIPWADSNISITCGSLPDIYRYNGGSYSAISPNSGGDIQPWTGYFIKVGETCTLTITK